MNHQKKKWVEKPSKQLMSVVELLCWTNIILVASTVTLVVLDNLRESLLSLYTGPAMVLFAIVIQSIFKYVTQLKKHVRLYIALVFISSDIICRFVMIILEALKFGRLGDLYIPYAANETEYIMLWVLFCGTFVIGVVMCILIIVELIKLKNKK